MPVPVIPPKPTCDLEYALQNVIDAYTNLDENERPSKLRKVLEKLPPNLQSVMFEVGTVFAGSSPNFSTSSPSFQSPQTDESTSEEIIESEGKIQRKYDPSTCENFEVFEEEGKAIHDGVNIDITSKNRNGTSEVLFFPSDVFGFFSTENDDMSGDINAFEQTDLALWNSTLHDFLILDE